ncbi:helix-turn-helix domain-containing protein [Pseudomonas sp. A-1]|uniref:helix-turn-helix domain-containing protein n=1 Tax=Pseudomonas sp. A-1 TaxID=1821274 RepID=UPI001454EB13|nr:helix-turn-helix domain-containing protein [Pseudomonas sp. A-1]
MFTQIESVKGLLHKLSKINSSDVVDRLQIIYGVNSDSALSTAMEQKRSTVGNWRNRGTVPYAECVNAAAEKGISLDWLLTGEGPMRRDEAAPAVAADAPAAPGISPREAAMLELFRSLDEDGQREIQGAAAEKKRLSALEQRIEELAAALEAVRQRA